MTRNEQIIAMAEQSATNADIARELNLSPGTVSGVVYRHNKGKAERADTPRKNSDVGVKAIPSLAPFRGNTSPSKACQWIHGAPCGDDHNKCLKPCKPGTSWCPEHFDRVYPKKKDAEMALTNATVSTSRHPPHAA